MKRQQAIKMLHAWHEDCIKAAKSLPKNYHAIVDTYERTFSSGTMFSYSACIWDEEKSKPALDRRWGYIYSFRTDETNVEEYNDLLEGFKADVERIANEHKK